MKQVIVLLGVVAMSLSAVLVRWSTAPSLVMVLYRMVLSALILAPSVFWKNRAELRGLKRREWLLCLVSGAFLGVHFAGYFEALRWTTIAAAVVLADTEVLFVALATVLLLRKKLPGKAWLAILLAFGGAVVIAMADTAVSTDALRGDVLALTAALCMSVYTMIGAICRKTVSTSVYTFLVYCMAAVTVAVIALCNGQPLTGYEPVNYLTGLGLAVFPTLLGHSVFSWGLKYLPPSFISTAKLLEPVLASVWGLLLFQEIPGAQVILGGIVVIGGVALYSDIERAQTSG